jgi:hypothetical protein
MVAERGRKPFWTQNNETSQNTRRKKITIHLTQQYDTHSGKCLDVIPGTKMIIQGWSIDVVQVNWYNFFNCRFLCWVKWEVTYEYGVRLGFKDWEGSCRIHFEDTIPNICVARTRPNTGGIRNASSWNETYLLKNSARRKREKANKYQSLFYPTRVTTVSHMIKHFPVPNSVVRILILTTRALRLPPPAGIPTLT